MVQAGVSANRLELLQIADALAREKSIDRKIVEAKPKSLSKSKKDQEASIGRLLLKLVNGDPYAAPQDGRHETALMLTRYLDRAFRNATSQAITALQTRLRLGDSGARLLKQA